MTARRKEILFIVAPLILAIGLLASRMIVSRELQWCRSMTVTTTYLQELPVCRRDQALLQQWSRRIRTPCRVQKRVRSFRP